MTTEKDLETLNLSPTNKDYYQVWSELIETASKISERWDPSSTNESDPGIVLLKVLTAITDKLNYNIDKNILEAFMPTAAQTESMKRLCDMLGYHMGYYESATTDVTVRYTGNTSTAKDNTERLPESGLTIPAFTVFHNEDKTIYYSTTQAARLTNEDTFVTIPCIEGQRVLCEIGTGNLVKLNNLDANNKFFLPEIQIAENGIFVYGTVDGVHTHLWKKVNNLNIISSGTKAYSFGYDSKENRPYLQFPADVGQLIEDGLEIYYLRTSGAAGNISAKTLSVLEKPTLDEWKDYSDNEKFAVNNPKAALNGKNPENIEQAYNGFKKTIGTFDTLVTCRDYMNKIYQLVDEQNNELVSNIIVSDIRDDINRAHTLCSFSDYGIVYLERGNKEKANVVINSTLDDIGIDHFDLILYPFKAYQRINDKNDFNNSFTFSTAQIPNIQAQLADIKSVAHSYSYPMGGEITCIKNYLKLDARISTTQKVNSAEEALILANVKQAIYAKFNLHELDFGEAIPYETILDCITKADPKIKSVALDEPILYTKFATAEGKEYDIASVGGDKTGKELYNKLALKNILAGRIELFRYDPTFKVELGEALYPTGEYSAIYPVNKNTPITTITTECKKSLKPQYDGTPLALKTNEVVKFRAPSLKTLTPYSAYVNYHLILNQKQSEPAEGARFLNLDQLWLKAIDNRVCGTPNKDGQIASTPNITSWTYKDPEAGLVAGKFTHNGLDFFDLFATSFINHLFTQTDCKEHFNSNKEDFVQTLTIGNGMIKTDDLNAAAFEVTIPEDGLNIAEAGTKLTAVYNSNAYIKADDAQHTLALDIAEKLDARIEQAKAQLQDLINNNILGGCRLLEVKDGKITLKFNKDKVDVGQLETNLGKNVTYYIIDLQNTAAVFAVLNSWANSFGTAETETADDPKDLISLASGSTSIFRNIGFSSDRLPGKQVTTGRIKYMPATQPDISETYAWQAYYWPAPRCRELEYTDNKYKCTGYMVELFADGWKQVEYEDASGTLKYLNGYAKTSLGTDMKLAGIAPLEEYQLKSNEYLFINYTPSSSSTSSDQQTSTATEPLNICHGPGTIIKPNSALTLYDSETYHSSGYHNWAKTTGFDFSEYAYGQDIEGMYSLAATEQIDIRDFIEVTLSEPSYLYWIFNEDVILSADGQTPPYYNSYTLKDGEYIFYTDKNKLDMAYYGAGTELRIESSSTSTRKFAFKKDIAQANLEDILVYGVSAVPWRMMSLDNNAFIVLREFQYLTLTEGDSFRGLVLRDGSDYLDNEWRFVDSNNTCYYYLSGDSDTETGTPLAKFNLGQTGSTEGTPNKGSDIGWEVRSQLELVTGPDQAQVLNEGNSIILESFGSDIETITPATDETGAIIPMAIKANSPVQSAGGVINLYASDVTLEDIDTQLAIKFKVFEDAPIATVSGIVDTVSTNADDPLKLEYITKFKDEVVSEDLNLYNFNTLWTSISAADFKSNVETADDITKQYSWVRVHGSVPADHYNLMMIYYNAPATTYQFGQSAGFRFYTYKNKPYIKLKSGSNNTLLDEFVYDGVSLPVRNKTLEGTYQLDVQKSSAECTGRVVIDSQHITFEYRDSKTNEAFKVAYDYEFDHTKSEITLGSAEPLLASVLLNKNYTIDDTDDITSEQLDYAICRGIKFKDLQLKDGNDDIIGIYTSGDRVIEILYNKINIITPDEGTAQKDTAGNKISYTFGNPTKTNYYLEASYYYNYDNYKKDKTLTLYTDEDCTEALDMFTAGVAWNTTGLNVLYNGTVLPLTRDSECFVRPVDTTTCLGDAEFFGVYEAKELYKTFLYENANGVLKMTTGDVESTSLTSVSYSYLIKNGTVTFDAVDRFLVDADHQHVKIFNNISKADLNYLLSDDRDSVQYFDQYFDKLSWWTQGDLGYGKDEDEQKTLAFGTKQLPSEANIRDSGDESANSSASAYRLLSDVYFLRPGLNIIAFKESGKFEFFPEIDVSGSLFFSDIDSIEKYSPDLGLNIETINYQNISKVSDLADRKTNKIAYRLLLDIKERDPNNEFYYNCPLQTATALDINTLLTGEDKEYLSDARVWYEPNNINNKFVVSQIDADYLDKGLVISKASKLR